MAIQEHIRRVAHYRPDRFTLLLIALAALGAGLALAREAAYGVGLHWDSINYIAVARNLLAGEGFANFQGSVYRNWPPLYPMLLAAASFGVFDPLDVAGPLNAVIFGLTVFVAGQYLRQRLASRFLAVWAGLAIALSLPLTELAAWALTGTPFILLATLALIQTDKFLSEGKTASLVWAAVFCALAWQTRYIGVAAPATVGLLLLFQHGAALRQKARRVAGFSLMVAMPMGLWLLRNYLAVRELTGRRPVDYSLWEILGGILLGISQWVVFDLPWLWLSSFDFLPLPEIVAAFAALAALVLIATVGISLRNDRRKEPGISWRPFYIFGGFSLIYVVLLVVAMLLGSTWHGVQSRFLVPLYVPLLIAATFVLDRLLIWERERNLLGNMGRLPVIRTIVREGAETPSLLTVALMAALALWVAGQIYRNMCAIDQANADGIGHYNVRMWAESATLRHIRENPIDGQVYSNVTILAYLHNAGAATYRGLPYSRPIGHIVAAGGGQSATGQEQLRRWIVDAPDGAYVVWIQNYSANHLYDYDEATMHVAPGLEPVAVLEDGVIFQVNKAYDPTAALRAEYAAILSGQPAARSNFDVYPGENALTYAKNPCAEADTAGRFFLHLTPADRDDLPAHRRQYGFDNLDFRFRERGGLLFDHRCWVSVPLPDYPIVRIRTGQFIPGEGQFWTSEFPFRR